MHLNFLSPFLAQAAPASGSAQQPVPTGAQALFNSPLPMIILFGIIVYFLMIRPQQKRAKDQALMLKNLKAGDRVGTSSGIIGTVVTVKDTSVTLRSADSKLEVAKSAVTEILESGTAAANPAAN